MYPQEKMRLAKKALASSLSSALHTGYGFEAAGSPLNCIRITSQFPFRIIKMIPIVLVQK